MISIISETNLLKIVFESKKTCNVFFLSEATTHPLATLDLQPKRGVETPRGEEWQDCGI